MHFKPPTVGSKVNVLFRGLGYGQYAEEPKGEEKNMNSNETPPFPARGDKEALTKYLATTFGEGIPSHQQDYKAASQFDDFLKKYFRQELPKEQKREYPRLTMATDLSAMLPKNGSPLTWPDTEAAITVEHSKQSIALEYSGGDIHYTAVNFPRYYARDLMTRALIAADQEMMHVINANLRDTFRNSTRLASQGLAEYTREDQHGLDGNVLNLELLHTRGKGDAKPKWDTPESRKAITDAMRKAAQFAARHGWQSTSHSTRGVAVMPMEIADQLRCYLTQDTPYLLSPSLKTESTFGLGKVMWVNGWEIAEDITETELPDPKCAYSTGWGYIDFLHPSKLGTAYALRNAGNLNHDTWQKALHEHGTVQGASRHLYQITLQLCDN